MTTGEGKARETQIRGSVHRFDRVPGRALCRHRRRRRIRLGAAALFLQRLDPRQLRLRPPAPGRADLLGHRGDLLPRHPHHRRSALRQCRREVATRNRRVRHARSPVRGLGADIHALRQSLDHARRQRAHLRPAAADLAVLRAGVDRRRVGGDPNCAAHLSTDLSSRIADAGGADQAGRMTSMSSDAIAIVGFVALFVLMLLRVPVGMAMGLVGVSGFAYIVGGAAALKNVGHTTMRTVTDYNFAVVPLFLLMGAFATTSGMSRELFRGANAFVGHLKGGLGIATIAACGGFAAICGSSVATAATFSKVAYPEMRAFGYPQSFATGVIAAGGTLGIMIPPSTVLAVYGLITEQDVGKLFIAGVLPGALAVTMYMITITVIGWTRPKFLPAGPRSSWKERLAGLRGIWATLLLFAFVIGGLYGGLFTATEAAGAGAGGAFVIGAARGRLSWAGIYNSLLETTRVTAAVFTVLIGAILFGYFLTITQTPQKVTEFLTGLGVGRYGVLSLIMIMYLVLGCLMDALAMIIITVPIIFPVIKELGFDPTWFGVIIVMTVELGLIHPPVGMNIFVIKSVVEDVKISTIFYGVLPFIVTDILRLIVLIAFPVIALYLPSKM